MTDQPTPRQDGQGNDETPAGYQPPQGSGTPAPPPEQHPQAQQPQAQQPQAGTEQFAQPGDPGLIRPPSYNQPGPTPPPLYNQPGEQYGSPYAQPGSPYGQPGGPYGQQPSPYGQPAYYGMPAEPKSLSIASMCCGIAVFVGFGFFILPQIAAVILGHMGLNKEPSGRGFAFAGLVMGYIGIALTLLAFVVFGIFVASTRSYTGNF